jgi:Sulfotransferase family
MLFADEKIAIFHPGKCGGTTIEHLFLRTLRDTNLAEILAQPCFSNKSNHTLTAGCRRRRVEAMIGFLHRNYSANGVHNIYLQHADIAATLYVHDREVIDPLFKITFVRNPFPRLLSAYYYNMWDRKLTFRDFVLYELPARHARNMPYTRNHFGDMHRYTHLNGRQYVDFLGKLENIEHDVAVLSDRLGIPLCLEREHKHARTVSSDNYDHYSQAYDADMVAQVERLYPADLALFDYRFERQYAFRPSPAEGDLSAAAVVRAGNDEPAIASALQNLFRAEK